MSSLDEHLDFTSDWMSENRADWQQIFDSLKPKSYLEVGSFEGRSACFVIATMKTVEEVVCIDTWQNYAELPDIDMEAAENKFNRNVAEATRFCESEGGGVHVQKYKGRSSSTLAGLCWDAKREGTFDVVYIDGSHKPEDVMLDMMLGIRLVRVGGVMIVDDYLWALDKHGDDLLDTPRIAIDAFGLVMRRYVADVPRLSLYQRFYQKTRRVP